MNSSLSGVPIAARRRLAATLGLFAVLFVAVGAVAATGRGTAAAPVFSAVAIVIAVLLALIAWGVQRSIKIDLAEQRLDAAIEEAIATHGGDVIACGCGHDHDPSELHVTDAEPTDTHHRHDASCSHDGSGAACSHDCETCVLAALRPSPSQTRSQRMVG